MAGPVSWVRVTALLVRHAAALKRLRRRPKAVGDLEAFLPIPHGAEDYMRPGPSLLAHPSTLVRPPLTCPHLQPLPFLPPSRHPTAALLMPRSQGRLGARSGHNCPNPVVLTPTVPTHPPPTLLSGLSGPRPPASSGRSCLTSPSCWRWVRFQLTPWVLLLLILLQAAADPPGAPPEGVERDPFGQNH